MLPTSSTVVNIRTWPKLTWVLRLLYCFDNPSEFEGKRKRDYQRILLLTGGKTYELCLVNQPKFVLIWKSRLFSISDGLSVIVNLNVIELLWYSWRFLPFDVIFHYNYNSIFVYITLHDFSWKRFNGILMILSIHDRSCWNRFMSSSSNR